MATAEASPLVLLTNTPGREEIEALNRLGRLTGQGELRAAILALIAKPGSLREKQAWREETALLDHADTVRAHVRKLSRRTRAGALERALRTFALASVTERRKLLGSARRVMSADGQVQPLDRLRWLTMHHLLGEAPVRRARNAAQELSTNAVSKLVDAQRADIATFTAFLARMVPVAVSPSAETVRPVRKGTSRFGGLPPVSEPRVAVGPAGARWYQTVMQRWWDAGSFPACHVPDPDALARALWGVQELSWMLHPVLVRTWVDEALRTSEPRVLRDEAAEALRLACVLLNAPLPSLLARCFVEPE